METPLALCYRHYEYVLHRMGPIQYGCWREGTNLQCCYIIMIGPQTEHKQRRGSNRSKCKCLGCKRDAGRYRCLRAHRL